MTSKSLQVLFQRHDFGKRRNLVVVRTGGESCHTQWTPNLNSSRTWDLCAYHYGSHKPPQAASEDFVVYKESGFKYPSLSKLLVELQLLDAYDYFWFPDDDIATDEDCISKLFEASAHYGLVMAQPALTLDSYVAHEVTRQQPEHLLRFTNFVEAMMPLFSREGLIQVLSTFDDTGITAFGIDVVWSSLLQVAPSKIGIIDSLPVRHTRPLGSGNLYQAAKKLGVSPQRELQENLRRFGVTSFHFIEYGAILRDPYRTPFPGLPS